MIEHNKADIFLNLTDSLSKYRRAELKDERNQNLIEKLYVDPLDNDLILKSMLKNNTTLLIGRKGTGKSTIINRFQHEIRKTTDKLSLYVDVKALFEQAKKSSFKINTSDITLENEDIEKLNLYIIFIKKIIDELNKEIQKGLFKNPIINFFRQQGITKSDFSKQLKNLFDNIEEATYIDITAVQQTEEFDSKKYTEDSEEKAEVNLSLEKQNLDLSNKNVKSKEHINSQEFTKILTRYFNIIEFMNELKELLKKLPINNVFICLDDMSEIDKESMEIFTDFIVGPLNNLSDEYFKFKISLYPGRDYLPSIDRQKVKTYTLDYYDLYSIGSTDKVEENAIKYTKRLIEQRFKYYYGNDVNMSEFFDINSNISLENYYKQLFQISSNVPRIMGKILEIALQKTNSLEKKITKKILQESAKQHYKNDIEFVLTKSEYIEYKSYDEAFEQYHLLELLNKIIDKAIQNKKHIGNSTAKIFEQYTTNTAPSNYLYISEEIEDILKTLEFNFFITKYSQQKDRDGISISVFSLNYGLCMDNNIIFDEKSDRKFRIERVFDFNKLITDWMSNSKELICSQCNTKYDIEQKDIFIKHNYPCLKCKGKVYLNPIIDEVQKEKIENNIKISQKEFEILNALNNKSPLTATELGNELDRAYQSINHSIGNKSKINHYKFIERRKEENSKPYFHISENGKLYLNGEYNKTLEKK